MSLDTPADPPPARRPVKCPRCGSRRIDTTPNPNMREGVEIECGACKYEGEPFPAPRG